nr:MAG TPA: hypothetical protein [Caudoviricetes sp.]
MENVKQDVYRYLKASFDYFSDTTFYFEDKKIKFKRPPGTSSMEYFVGKLKEVYTKNKDINIKDLYQENANYPVRVVCENFLKMYDETGNSQAEFEKLKKEINHSLKQIDPAKMSKSDPLAYFYTLRLISKFRVEFKKKVIKYNQKNQFDGVAIYYRQRYKNYKRNHKNNPRTRKDLVDQVIDLSEVFIMDNLTGVNEVKAALDSIINKLKTYRAKLSSDKLSSLNDENKANIVKVYKQCCKIMNVVYKNVSVLKRAIVKAEFILMERELKKLCFERTEKVLQEDTKKRKLEKIEETLSKIYMKICLLESPITANDYRNCIKNISDILKKSIIELKDIVDKNTLEKDTYYKFFNEIISCCNNWNQKDGEQKFEELAKVFDELLEYASKENEIKIGGYAFATADNMRYKQ